ENFGEKEVDDSNQRTESIKDRTAVLIGNLFRAQEITNTELRSVNRTEIEKGGITIPE
ncbi:MAG: hypothetical protein EZS28_046098, partial [Streblomastix strix]